MRTSKKLPAYRPYPELQLLVHVEPLQVSDDDEAVQISLAVGPKDRRHQQRHFHQIFARAPENADDDVRYVQSYDDLASAISQINETVALYLARGYQGINNKDPRLTRESVIRQIRARGLDI